MKKSLLILSIFLSALTLHAQYNGRVRVYLTEFDCIQEAADDNLAMDGKGNEIFFHFHFFLADKNGALKQKNVIHTEVYGDNSIPAYSTRIHAGTALTNNSFSSPKGGVWSHDKIKTYKIVGEYDLLTGDVLSFIPTIWEWNVGTSNDAVFDAAIDNA